MRIFPKIDNSNSAADTRAGGTPANRKSDAVVNRAGGTPAAHTGLTPHTPGARKARLKWAVVLLAVALCATAVFAYAKYMTSWDTNNVVYAKQFYFTSDLLDGATHTLAAGTTEVTFTIGNHEDDLRYSEVDIAYTIVVEGGEGVVANPSGGTLQTGEVRDVSITLSGLQNGKTYIVTATGVGGYTKELTATIKVQSAEAVVYKYLDTSNSEYALLTVWSLGYEGAVKITFPNSVVPDNTDTAMSDVAAGEGDTTTFTDSLTFASGGYTSHVYRFFKSGAAAIDGLSADSFSVTYGDGTGVQAATKKPS